MCWLCNVKDNSVHVLEEAQTSVQQRKVRRQNANQPLHNSCSWQWGKQSEINFFSLFIKTFNFVDSSICNPKAALP